MPSYRADRDVTPAFLDIVRAWIDDSGEVLVVMRYLCSAGAKDFALITSAAEFDCLLAICPVGTDIIVFREPQLPLRGIVDTALISRIHDMLKDEEEYLIVDKTEIRTDDPRLRARFDSTESLIDDLENLRGRDIAAGPCPAFWKVDSDVMISASKGGIDGPR